MRGLLRCRDVVLLPSANATEIQAHLSLFVLSIAVFVTQQCVRNKDQFQVAVLTNGVLAAPQQNQANDGCVRMRQK